MDEQTKYAVRAAVAATLRQMSGWGMVWDDGLRADDELLSLANQVEGMGSEDMPCPMCQEIDCDGDCPLAPVRDRANGG